MELESLSKAMSKALRHDPGSLGITLDECGWVSTQDLYFALLDKFKLTTVQFGPEHLHEIVDGSDKRRFGWNEDRTKIRANQGHSIEVQLDLEPRKAPYMLYHGTAVKTRGLISENGLRKMGRQHVHLSKDLATAVKVGRRHGKPTVFMVLAKRHQAETGASYYLSENGVWLTDHVPPKYLVEMVGQDGEPCCAESLARTITMSEELDDEVEAAKRAGSWRGCEHDASELVPDGVKSPTTSSDS